MSSIMRRRNGPIASSVMGMLLSWVKVANPSSQDRTPGCAILLAVSPAAAAYRASGLVHWRKANVQSDDRSARNFMPAAVIFCLCQRFLVWIMPSSATSTLLSRRHAFPFASILARISDFSTLPTLERGRSSHTSICLGVLTLPTRCFTKADTAATSTVRPALG
jgi:hypothetical protein